MSSKSDGSTFNTDISADPSAFEAGVQRAMSAATGASGQIKAQFDKVAETFEEIQKPLMVLGSLMAGGAFFKEAISAANALNGEATKLSRALGITGDEAATLRTALGDIYSDSDTYIGAFQKFAKQIKTNEDGLNAMGLQTRDSNGALRDSNTLFTEALHTVGAYKPGLDQTTAAMTLFGKGVDEVMTLQKLNNQVLEDAKQKNEDLGMTLTKEGVQATKAYKAAMNDVGDVMEAVKNTIGKAVMPVFTELGNYFASSGPDVVNVFKGALTGLVVMFRVVQGAVQTMANVIFEVISTVVDGAGLMGDVFSKLFKGDFGGAVESAKALGSRVGQGFKNGMTSFIDVGNEVEAKVKADMARIWGQGTAVDAPKGGTKTMGDFGKTNGGKKADSQMPGFEAELEAMKVATTQKGLIEGQYRELSKAEEAKYWNEVKARSGLSRQDQAMASKKAAEAELAVIKQTFEQKAAILSEESAQYKNNTDAKLVIERQLQAMYQQGTKEYEAASKRIGEIERQAVEQSKQVALLKAQATRDAALQTLALEEQATQQSAELGIISQAQALELEAQYQNRRTEIARQALQVRLQDALMDPDRNPVQIEQIHQQIEQLEQQHQLKMGQIKGLLIKEDPAMTAFNNVMSNMQSTMAAGMNGMIQRTMTMRQAVGNMYKGLTQTITSEIAKWIMLEVAAMAKKRLMALGVIGTNAATAGAGAAASQADIPIAGPFLAAGAMAATFAAVMAMGSRVPSAAGGFDIPKGVNPLTQLHEREMVLPARHADVIRAMADGGGGAGGGDTHQWNISALDARSFEGFLRNGGADKVVDALAERRRNGRF